MYLLTGAPLWAASLVGTQVSGALYFIGYDKNFFDPVNGGVPAGYLNHSGTTVTISSNAVEYGYADSTATITADFTNMQVTVTDHSLNTANYNAIELVFTNSAFSNLLAGTNSFPNGGMSASLDGDVLTLDWAGGDLTSGGTVQAVFYLNVPPAPPLSLQRAPANAVLLSWPATATGYNLQQNTNLNPASWVGVATTPTVTNGQNQVLVSPPVGTQFYRLKFP
jgi:hypothetical protein